MLKPCIKKCGHLAHNGVHPKDGCPPPQGIHGDHRKGLKRRKRRRAAINSDHEQRGMPVAGTGKPSASSPGKAAVRK